MRRAALLACIAAGPLWAASWPPSTATLLAKDGAACEMRILPGAGAKPVWEGRILAKHDCVRVINRRAAGSIPAGPEELLWTGKGAVKFMGGRPGEFLPGPRLTLAEVYLLTDLLTPLWTPSTPSGNVIDVEGHLGKGHLTLTQDGRPESLVVSTLSRPLWDGSGSVRIVFSHKGESSPWATATLVDPSGSPLMTLERVRFRRDALPDDLFTVDEGSGLKLADLSKPLGQLVGADDGGYAETAGSSAAFKSSKMVSSGGSGSVYLGPVPTPDEVDRFLMNGKLGRYADE